MNVQRKIAYGFVSSLLLVFAPVFLQAAEVKVVDTEGESFTLTDAMTIHYNIEGSLGGSAERISGLRAQTTTGKVEIPWTDIHHIQVTGPQQATVIQVDKQEREVSFDLQGVTGSRDGKTVTISLDQIKTLEVVRTD